VDEAIGVNFLGAGQHRPGQRDYLGPAKASCALHIQPYTRGSRPKCDVFGMQGRQSSIGSGAGDEWSRWVYGQLTNDLSARHSDANRASATSVLVAAVVGGREQASRMCGVRMTGHVFDIRRQEAWREPSCAHKQPHLRYRTNRCEGLA